MRMTLLNSLLLGSAVAASGAILPSCGVVVDIDDGQPEALDVLHQPLGSDIEPDAPVAALADLISPADEAGPLIESAGISEIEIVRVEGVHPGDTSTCIHATCPAGKVVLGGGGYWSPQIELDNSRPTGGDRWSLCGYSEAGPEEWFVEAVCARADGHEIVTAEGVHPGQTSTCISATCPAGKVAVGGGGYWSPQIELDNNRPLGADEWALCGYVGEDSEEEWFVQAVCVEQPDASLVTAEGLHPGQTGTCISATCPAGKVAVGGGGYWSPQIELDNNRPLGADEWALCGYVGEDSEEEWFAQAICVNPGDDEAQPDSGLYRIQVVADGRYLHEDGFTDRLLSTRFQPDDNFTYFYLERQEDGSYRIWVLANGRYLHEDGLGDRLLSTRYQPDDEFTRFFFEPQDDGSYRVRVAGSGRYLHEDGLGDRLLSTRYQPDDEFTRFLLEPASEGAETLLYVRHSEKCIDVDGRAQHDEADVIQWDCNSQANQRLIPEPTQDGYHRFRFVHSGKCLEVAESATEDDALVWQYECNGGPNQEFALIAHGDHDILLQARHSGKCVAVRDGSVESGAEIVQRPCDAGDGQAFVAVP